MQLTLAGHAVNALSIGGVETCYDIPAFDVCLDIGRCPPGSERRSTLLLTHAHIDHAAGLPYYVSMRGLYRLSPPNVYCPAPSHPHLAALLAAWGRLQADSERCNLVPVTPGDVIPLSHGSFAKTFRSPHRIDCVGYTLTRRVKKLKPTLIGLSHGAIAARAQSGEDVQAVVDRDEICFPGDTLIDVVESEPSVGNARVLFLECTFMETKVSVKKARAGGHVHLDEIAERADLFHNEVLLLTHFSRRYRPNEIAAAVEQRLPPKLKERVQLLIHEDLG